MRTMPMPPAPGGVAMATMVSSGENTRHPFVPSLPLGLRRDDHRLHERVADALRAHRRIFGDGEVHDAPLVGIERTHLLRHPAVARLVGNELRHLAQLGVL